MHNLLNLLSKLPLVEAETESDDAISPSKLKSKKRASECQKPGIIYLSTIPPGFNVSRTTAFFAQFGQVGRVFLQPGSCLLFNYSHGQGLISNFFSDLKEKEKSKDGIARHFIEGWVEFLSKKVAKDVAGKLNNTQVGGKKRSKAHDVLWNIKYLSK
jgi:ESF2/ABP1 family protein